MKPILTVWLLAISPLAAAISNTTLTLVNETNYNKVTVTIDPGSGLADTKTTTMTGTVQARLDIDAQAATTSELTLSNGRANGTNMTFAKSLPFGLAGYTITVANVSAAVYTIAPPGVVTAATGQFAAEQHKFDIDQGTVTGSTSGLIGANAINESFTPGNPASGTGSGTGTVTLVPAGDSGGVRTFNVTVIMPIAIADSFVTGSTTVNITASGTLKATGSVQVPLTVPGYSSWSQQISNSALRSFDSDSDGDGVPNGVEYVLNGNPALIDPKSILPVLDPSGASTVKFSFFRKTASTTDTVQTVQYGTNLSAWTDVPVYPNPAANVLVEDQGGGISKVTVTLNKPGPKMLVRLKVTQL